MRTREFLNKLDHKKIAQAIAAAEVNTSGEIRIYIERGPLPGDVLAEAEKQFLKLGMQETRERNAVLILVVPRAQKFAVVGDEGVHQKCGKVYWQGLIDAMHEHFLHEDYNQALVEAIERTGELLARHFPKEKDRGNELPDEVVQS